MRVMKFGGTSVGDAARMCALADRVAEAAAESRTVVVVSAISGITNLLLDGIRLAVEEGSIEGTCDRFRAVHAGILLDLTDAVDSPVALRERIDALASELRDLLLGIRLLRDCSPKTQAHLASLGERASAEIIAAVLAARGLAPQAIDPRAWMAVEGDPLQAQPRLNEVYRRFAPWREGSARVAICPGFFGGDAQGKTALLGRGGSDFSAAIVASAVDAEVLEIWTDVDGIYSADPRVVPEAFPLAEVSFEEAMELSYFGAKVLHPKTIAPAREKGIPVRVCNSFRPERPGTWVRAVAAPPLHAVRGISFLKGIALLDVAGPGMKGVPGVAARVFGALAARDISVILITQASSECSISLCVNDVDAERAVNALHDAFEAEITAHKVDEVRLRRGLCVLSIVGDGMHERMGVAGQLFGALAAIACNVVAIAQGSSERNISVVIEAVDGERAMNHVHRRFFDTREVIEVYLAGVGTVGSRLLAHIERQRPKLLAQNIDLRVCGIGTSRGWRVDAAGVPAEASGHAVVPLEEVLADVRRRRPTHPVFVDCTTSEAISRSYPALFEAGLHVVTANKKANASESAFYKELRRVANRRQRKFLYETNVGAGLPVIDTVKNLVKSGDQVLRFEGILSGSLSYIFGRLDEGVPFSAAVLDARERGFTEPDPRDDLSGLDVARKVLILAREAGFDLDLSDLRVEGALPADFAPGTSVDEFLRVLPELDAPMAERIRALRAEGRALRFVGAIDAEGCRVGPLAVGSDHPLHAVRGGENALSFLTSNYQPRPMVIRGYGAGADVTAAGVLSDVLRLVFWNHE